MDSVSVHTNRNVHTTSHNRSANILIENKCLFTFCSARNKQTHEKHENTSRKNRCFFTHEQSWKTFCGKAEKQNHTKVEECCWCWTGERKEKLLSIYFILFSKTTSVSVQNRRMMMCPKQRSTIAVIKLADGGELINTRAKTTSAKKIGNLIRVPIDNVRSAMCVIGVRSKL